MAASCLTALPVVVFFLILQGRIATGLDGRGRQGMSDELDRCAHAVLVAATGGTIAPAAWLARRLERGLGGVCLFGRNMRPTSPRRGAHVHRRAAGVRADVLVCTDEEGGDVTRLHHGSGSPHLGALALAADRRPRRHQGHGRGDRARARRGRCRLEPGAGRRRARLRRRARSSGYAAFGPDPADVARHVAAYVEGLRRRRRRVRQALPGHGATDADSHTGLPRVAARAAGPERLERVDLVPFRAAVDAGVETVMLGHLVVEAVDPELPASLSAGRRAAAA